MVGGRPTGGAAAPVQLVSTSARARQRSLSRESRREGRQGRKVQSRAGPALDSGAGEIIRDAAGRSQHMGRFAEMS